MALALDSSDLAVRLAAEGVPVACIARVTKIPSSDLRECLLDAQLTGQLLAMPCNDWPVGTCREQRALQLAARLAVDHEDDLALMRLFDLTTTEARLLAVMVQCGILDKNRYGMSGKAVDVHINHIRKRLRLHKIAVTTLWGIGYQLETRDRQKALALLMRHVDAEP